MKPVAREPGEVVVKSLRLVFHDNDGSGGPSGGSRCGGFGEFVEEGLAVLVCWRENRCGEFEIVFESVGEGEEVTDVVVVQDEPCDGDGDGFLIDGRVGEELEVGGVDGCASGGCDLVGLLIEGGEVERAGPTAC